MWKEMYDNSEHVRVTFWKLPKHLEQAQRAESVELNKIIINIWREKLVKILDIGIWDARVLKNIFELPELYNKIEKYIWIDVAQNCIDISKSTIIENDRSSKAKAILSNAKDIDKLESLYDLIICTWFTAGNFYPSNYNIYEYQKDFDLSKNDNFTEIFYKAYNKLNKWGKIVIWSVYKDNDSTRLIQEQAYKYFWRDIVSQPSDSFTASKDWRRSLRFTEKRIKNYLPFISPEQIEFIPLDAYDFAMMVVINKSNL